MVKQGHLPAITSRFSNGAVLRSRVIFTDSGREFRLSYFDDSTVTIMIRAARGKTATPPITPRNVIALWEQERRLEERFPFVVRDDQTGELLGGCELLPLDDAAANLSFWTCPGHRGRGIATRAVALICDHALEEMEFRCLEIVTDEDNAGARKVALQSGFEELGHRGERLLYVFPGAPARSHSG